MVLTLNHSEVDKSTMKSTYLVVLYMLGVIIRRVSLCELLQECTNCKAAQSCGSYREMKTNVTKCECIDILETAGTVMVEYDTNQGTCKSFNMCQGREEAMGYNAFIKSCRTDCSKYTIETRIHQSGSCYEISRTLVGITHACLQFCLHRDGCMAITHLMYSSGTIICIFHNCTQSVPEPTNNSTFIGITCSDSGVASNGNLPCHISQTSQAPTTTSPILTTSASREKLLSSAESWDLSTSGSASYSMTKTVPKTIHPVSLSTHTTNVTLVMTSTVSYPGGTILTTGNTSLHGRSDFFSKPSNIAAVSAAGGIAAVGGLLASACLLSKKSKLTKRNIN